MYRVGGALATSGGGEGQVSYGKHSHVYIYVYFFTIGSPTPFLGNQRATSASHTKDKDGKHESATTVLCAVCSKTVCDHRPCIEM